MRMLLSLDFALVEAGQVLGTGIVIEGDLLDGMGGLSFLRRRRQYASLGPWLRKHVDSMLIENLAGNARTFTEPYQDGPSIIVIYFEICLLTGKSKVPE